MGISEKVCRENCQIIKQHDQSVQWTGRYRCSC